MKIIPLQDMDVSDVVAALRSGETVVYPTETCYGLGCDARDDAAVAKIFDIKRRQRDKSLLVVVSDIAMIREYVIWNQTMQQLADRYWPGPLTVVADVMPSVSLPDGVVRVDGTIAFRVTNHPIAAALSSGIEGPIVSTSANIASEENPYDIEQVLQSFAESDSAPDVVIDAGTLPHRLPSTIVKLVGSDIVVLRQGDVVL